MCSAHDPEHLAPLHQNDPHKLADIVQYEADLEAFTQQYAELSEEERGGNAYVIPVVFHIIHNNGVENIGDAQIHDAIRVLNDDFNRLNADWDNVRPEFLGIVADVGITFRLAQLDPNGECTSGITRTASPLTNDGTQTMKDLIQWPRNKYLNVWTCAYADGAAGYTLTPGSVNGGWGAAADGIVLLHDYTGSIGTSSVGRSRTLTHEVGHWINLRHVWGPTNEPGLASNCNETDNVSDTPPTEGWTSCNLNGNTCTAPLDNVENYMEYSYCAKMFTEGQKTRMLAALNSSTAQRNQLGTPTNLTATGTTGTDVLCAAEFISNVQQICAGGSVSYSDISYHGVTERSWSFPGGTPSSSTDVDPVITYSTPGLYAVTLTAGNGNMDVTTQANDYILVLPDPGLPTPFTEGFENTTALPNADWAVADFGGNGTFQLVATTGYQSSKSIRLNNHVSALDEIDELVSTSFDMSNAQDVTITYRYAFARHNADNNDLLRLYVSSDCGNTWSLRQQLYGTSTLSTSADQASAFTPTQDAQWAETSVSNISSSYFVSDFRFKFRFQSDEGNNLFLDNININGTPVGFEELITSSNSIAVVPNPVNDASDLVLELRESGRLAVDVLDPQGRVVRAMPAMDASAGAKRISLPVRDLAPGMYVVVLHQNGRGQVTRFTKE
ncbi:MAG: choice-of-anchor J domain-containing protein [Flavobacteriales bacterium]|nr:choice-of-anchor J domain-containing protein [Flavobacteriales bacterium]